MALRRDAGFYIAVVIAALFFASLAYCEEPVKITAESVKMTLSSEKAAYSAGEPVELTIALVNMTGLDKSLAVRVCPRLDIDSYIYILAKDETGKTYKGFLGSGEDIETFHLHTPYILKPREEKRFKFNLARLFANRNAQEELPITDIAGAPGAYTISAGIQGVSLESAPVNITIVAPPQPPAEPAQEPAQESAPGTP